MQSGVPLQPAPLSADEPLTESKQQLSSSNAKKKKGKLSKVKPAKPIYPIAPWCQQFEISDLDNLSLHLSKHIASARLDVSDEKSAAYRVLGYFAEKLERASLQMIPVGSLSTGLALSDSDLDVAIPGLDNLKQVAKLFEKLNAPFFSNLQRLEDDLDEQSRLRQRQAMFELAVSAQDSLQNVPSLKFRANFDLQPRGVFPLLRSRVPIIKILSSLSEHRVTRSFSYQQPIPRLLSHSSTERLSCGDSPLIQSSPFPADIKALSRFDLAKVCAFF